MIIACFSYKGGASKTTTALNLGAALIELGQSVRLIDLDLSGTLYEYRNTLRSATFESTFEALNTSFEGWTLIDCPPALPDTNAVKIVRRADMVIVPAHPARVACNEALDAAQMCREENKPARLLMTKHVAQKPYSHDAIASLQKAVKRMKGTQMCQTVIPFAHAAIEAENAAQTVFQVAPRSAVARAHLKLAKEVMTWI